MVDAGDADVNPFSIDEVITQVQASVEHVPQSAGALVAIGGDLTDDAEVGFEVVSTLDVAPAHDHAELTALAAANLVQEYLAPFALVGADSRGSAAP